MDRSPTAIFIVQLNSAASDVAGSGVPTVLCPNCHTLVKVPTNFTLYRCCNCLVNLQDLAAAEGCAAETPISAPLPPKDGKAVGFISSFFKKKRQINFFRRSPNYEQKLAPSPSSGLTEQSSKEAMSFGLACVFPYEELKEATNGFHESGLLGGGGIGRVYLGKLKDGRRVAVKKLYDDNPMQLEQFFNEVTALSRLRHKNLVALYGCTNQQSRKKLLLVYEFIPNGTLADHLHGKRPSLPWAVRIRIAIEMAEALTYLHSLEPPIIHRDIKTFNILLDNAFQVKVADLGMCRRLPWDSTYVSTAPQGTLGYRDPEYDLYLKLTDKCDVYSFGVVLLELVSGKLAVDVNRAVGDDPDMSEIYLTSMGLNKIQNNQVELLVDPELGYHSKGEIRRMVDSVIKLACKCLQTQGYTRPCMIEVLRALKTIEEMVKTEEATTVDLQKNNVTPEINQTSTTHPLTQIIETKMENKRRPIEAAREVAFSGLNNILYESKIELGEAYTSSSLPSNSGLIVYQGKLTDGRTVKALKGYNSNRMEEFYKVVNSHSIFCHQNLVTLYGCPDQRSRELLLVYELLPNGTLADHLLVGKHVSKGALNLDVRIQIAIDTAQALAYLHSFYPPVVHGRVKTDTILLDNNFSAKIVDLGLCHLLPSENEQLSAKRDVYSFGVVLMELISGNHPVDINRYQELISGNQAVDINRYQDIHIHLTSLDKKLKKLFDNKLGYKITWSVSTLAQLSFWCFHPNENNRPHMKEVLSILEGIKEQQKNLNRTS